MMFQGKHIHYSPVDNKPLCSYSVKLCKQRRLKDYAFCIRHILEDKSAPFKQCAHVAKYKKQKCTNPIPANQDRHLCNSHMQVEGFIPKVPKKKPKDKNKDKDINLTGDGKVKFADRLRALLRNEDCAALSLDPPASSGGDPYAFPDPGSEKNDDVLPGAFYPSRGFWNTNSNKPVQTANDRVSSNNSKICEQSNNLFGNFHQNDNNYSNLGVGNVPAQLPKTHQMQLGTTLNNNSDSSSSSGCSNATPKSSCSSSGPSCESVQAQGGKTKPNGPKFAKTMNRLQAKIARNKVLDKLKKSQQESSTSTSQNGSKICSNQTAALPKLTFNATNVKKEAGMIKNLPLINGNHKELLNRQLCSAQPPVCIRQIQQRTSVANIKQSKSSSKSPGSRASASKGTKREATAPSLIKASSFPTPFSSNPTNREQTTTNLNPPVKSRANKNVTFSSTNPNLWASASSSNGGVYFPSTAAATNQINSLARNTIQSAGSSNLTSTSALKEVKKEHPIDTINVKIEKTLPVSRKKELVAKLTQQSQKFVVKSRKKEDYFYHGFISSDSEDSDDADDCTLLKRINWCSGLECNAPTWCSTKATTRQGKQQALKSEMRRYGQLANKALSIEECVLEHQLKMARNVVQATQLYPKTTAQLLFKKYPSKIKKKLTGIGLEKNTCCYQSDKLNCSNVALPYTRHCIKHIMYNVDQLLFEHCTAKFADNTQCCVPVFDISHELPLCAEHAKKRDNYNKMASEPKAKKARKKTKASSLTRPTKRGKKKKRLSSSLIRPDSAPSSPVNDSGCKFNSNSGVPDNNSDSVAFGTAIAEESTEANNLPKPIEENMESELGSELEDHFSPGTIEKSLELPLDTAELARQATKLLEEHDFTEVLNKIPDDAFSDLFNDGRNGEYIPTKEETEELERALAAVSKDVHLAKESLAKLTVTRQDIEELSSNIALPSALIAAENLTSTLDANALNDMESLNVMTGLSSSDLNSLSQAFNDGLAPSDSHPGLSVSHLGQNSHVSASDSRATASTSSSMPVLDSDVPLHLRLSSSMLSVNSLNPHLSNGETTNECLLNQGSEYGLSSQFLENAINIYGAAAVAAGISHGVTDTGDLLVGPPDPSLLGGSLVCGQFVNHDSNLMLGSSSLVGGGRLDGTVSEDELLSLPNLTACTPQWLLNSSMVSQNSGYQNGFLNPAVGGNNVSSLTLQQNASLSQQLLSKFPLQSLNVESVSLLANHDNLTMTGLEQYQDNLTRVTSKELRGYSRTVTSTAVNQQETKTTMLAQEGAS